MRRASARAHLVTASLVALLLVGLTAAPTVGAEPRRIHSAEGFAFKLTNCLRTGGKVRPIGTCKGWGSGRYSAKRPPLKHSQKISNKVSWPWAKRAVKANICGHTLAGSTVDSRFRTVRLKAIDNGENIGCSYGWTTRRMVIAVIRWWQDEKAWRGPHWRQLKAWKFKSAGAGVARLPNGRSRLVVDFYGKVAS